jgi:hypothetical protein
MLMGVALLFGNGSAPLIGIFSIMYGGVQWFLAEPSYSVVIHTPAGEVQAYTSQNRADAENVLTALNVAIALKGDTRE